LNTTLAILLLADGRFPAGGHAHSGGVEAAIADGRITDIDSLAAFVEGRLLTVGLTEAALAAAAVAATDLRRIDDEADVRILAPPLRDASRRLGRSLARAASRAWPHPVWLTAADAGPNGLHQPVALGVACTAAGGSATDAATVAVHHAINTPALAAVRLLGFDPLEVAALTARLAAVGDDVVGAAVDASYGALADLPALGGPLLDVAALEHRDRSIRMFAT